MTGARLPSPRAALRYRVESLRKGPRDNAAAGAIEASTPAGPLMLLVSDMASISYAGLHTSGR
eukprot:5728078-Lingulodinium_polyedra.AAC.1